MRSTLVMSAVFTLAVASVAHARQSSTTEAFTRLRDLAGDWEGTSEWAGDRTGTGAMNARYYLTGNGTALVEDLTVAGEPVMTSVYHMDGADLRVTHYCAAGNQPRLKAQKIDLPRGDIAFSLVDITNLRSPDAGHVVALDVHLIDADHLTLLFWFESGDKRSRETVTLKRSKSAAGS